MILSEFRFAFGVRKPDCTQENEMEGERGRTSTGGRAGILRGRDTYTEGCSLQFRVSPGLTDIAL